MPAWSTPGSPLCQHHKAETLVIPASPRGIPVGSPTEDSSQAQLTPMLARPQRGSDGWAVPRELCAWSSVTHGSS